MFNNAVKGIVNNAQEPYKAHPGTVSGTKCPGSGDEILYYGVADNIAIQTAPGHLGWLAAAAGSTMHDQVGPAYGSAGRTVQ